MLKAGSKRRRTQAEMKEQLCGTMTEIKDELQRDRGDIENIYKVFQENQEANNAKFDHINQTLSNFNELMQSKMEEKQLAYKQRSVQSATGLVLQVKGSTGLSPIWGNGQSRKQGT